jgi:ATP-dependent Clp protease adapter protein ClpS
MPIRRRCDVLLVNDDETPMAFVVTVLERFFGMSIWRPLRTWAVPKHATAITLPEPARLSRVARAAGKYPLLLT